MKKYYFGVPFGYEYDWSLGGKYGHNVLSRMIGKKVTFICNTETYKYGDTYAIDIEDDEDIIMFRLKYGFDEVQTDIVENYVAYYEKMHNIKHEINIP